MTPTFYDAVQVSALLDYPGCIAAVRQAMMELSVGGRSQPLRLVVDLGGTDKLGVMPGDAGQAFGAKLVSVFADRAVPGRSRHQGIVVLFEAGHGGIACLADAEAVTAIRTGCASAAATDVLARPDAEVAAIFGTGRQAESHARALCHVRPLRRLIIWGRTIDGAQILASRLARELGVPVKATVNGRSAAKAADIISTVSSSTKPILLGEWVRPGTHVNLVGSSHLGPVEIDRPLVVAARYFADHLPSVLVQAAELADAREAGLVDDTHVLGEIGEVFANRIVGRRSEEEVTVYKSLGHAVQDLAAVAYLDARARGNAITGPNAAGSRARVPSHNLIVRPPTCGT